MKKISLFVLLFSFCCIKQSLAYDFTFDELVKLKSLSLHDFEDAVLLKGYKLVSIEKVDDHCARFKNGNHSLYYYASGNVLRANKSVSILFTTKSRDEYVALKETIKLKEGRTAKVHLRDGDPELHHFDLDDDLTAHLWRVINYEKQSHLYKIEILNHLEDGDKIYYRTKSNVNFQQ